MIEIKEVLRQWLAGIPKKRIAAQLGDGLDGLTDERVSKIVVALESRPERTPGESRQQCVQQHAYIEGQLAKGVRLTTIHRRRFRESPPRTRARHSKGRERLTDPARYHASWRSCLRSGADASA